MMMMTMMMIMIMIATRDMDSSTLHSANPTYKLQSWEESVLYSWILRELKAIRWLNALRNTNSGIVKSVSPKNYVQRKTQISV